MIRVLKINLTNQALKAFHINQGSMCHLPYWYLTCSPKAISWASPSCISRWWSANSRWLHIWVRKKHIWNTKNSINKKGALKIIFCTGRLIVMNQNRRWTFSWSMIHLRDLSLHLKQQMTFKHAPSQCAACLQSPPFNPRTRIKSWFYSAPKKSYKEITATFWIHIM